MASVEHVNLKDTRQLVSGREAGGGTQGLVSPRWAVSFPLTSPRPFAGAPGLWESPLASPQGSRWEASGEGALCWALRAAALGRKSEFLNVAQRFPLRTCW